MSLKEAFFSLAAIPLVAIFFFIPFGIALAGWIMGDIWMFIGIIAGALIFIWQIMWFSKGHEEGELKEWKRLAKNPDYEPSYSEVAHDISGKSRAQIRRLAQKRIREMSGK